MLTIKMLREDPQRVIEKLAVKNFDAKDIVAKVLELDANRRALQTERSEEGSHGHEGQVHRTPRQGRS